MRTVNAFAFRSVLITSTALLSLSAIAFAQAPKAAPKPAEQKQPAKSGPPKPMPEAKPENRGTPTDKPGDQATADATLQYVRVDGVAKDQLAIDVTAGPPEAANQLHLVTKDTVVKDRLSQLHVGDRITIVYSVSANQNVLKVFRVDTATGGPESRTRAWVLLASAGICLLFYGSFSRLDPRKLIIGEDNRYSNSKFQIAVWFFVLITTYIATLWLRVWYAGWDFIGGVNIPQNLLLISGMSVLTFGGAKAITTSKVEAEKAKGNPDPKDPANAAPNFLLDLTHNDGKPAAGAVAATPSQLDFGDFQMFVITLIAVATYLVLVFNFLGTIEISKVISLPDVDTTILATFGLGHGAYLTKKAVGTVGQS